MTIELRPTSRWWYGRYTVHGKRKLINLKVEVKGTRPTTPMGDSEDSEFLESRGAALESYKGVKAQVEEKRSDEKLVQRLHVIRTGKRIESVPLSSMDEAWVAAPKARRGSDADRKQVLSMIGKFTRFLKRKYPDAVTMMDVTGGMAAAYLATVEKWGVSPRTFNIYRTRLKGVFNALSLQASLVSNPFDKTVAKGETEDTITRRPFTPPELARILKQVENDPSLRPVIITAMCTAMRRGDVCLLRWADVDMVAGFITVKASKGGRRVDIPIFPLLRTELERRPQDGEFCFPEVAHMYLENAQGITYRVKKALADAGFKDENGNGTQVCRDHGKRRASVRDLHSFRTTWITLALTAGVPLDIVRRVTGHRTADVVLEHYFQPGREDFKRTLERAMPGIMLEGGRGEADEAQTIITRLVDGAEDELTRRDLARLGQILAAKSRNCAVDA
jgi:integrase